MKGVTYVVDDSGERQAVLIDLKVNRQLWEDFSDAAIAEERASEPRETLSEVKKLLSDSTDE